MGKYEREWVNRAERAVSDAINALKNGKSTNEYIDKIALSIIEHIEKKFNTTVISSKHTGENNYERPGDMEVSTTEHSIIPVELKFSKDDGEGTKGNHTTNIVKTYLSPPVMNYPEFDIKLGLKDKRYDLVEKYINRDLKNDADYKRMLREIKYEQKDKDFMKAINEITKPGKVKYASYIAEKLNDQLIAAQNLVDAIFAGNNTKEAKDFNNKVVYCVINYFESEKQSVKYKDFDEMDSTITKVIPSGQSVKFQNKSDKVVLRFSVHWKNIVQGGGNPCFNSFLR